MEFLAISDQIDLTVPLLIKTQTSQINVKVKKKTECVTKPPRKI